MSPTTMYGGKTLHRSGLSVIKALMDNENYNISIGNSMICSDIWHKYHE